MKQQTQTQANGSTEPVRLEPLEQLLTDILIEAILAPKAAGKQNRN